MLLGLLKTIFFLLIFYYSFKVIGQLLMPFLIKRGFAKMQKRQEQATNQYRTKAKQEEGKVTVHVNHNKTKPTPQQDNGEYVDYEEVK